ncbi:MAG: GCN5-related N-acetyltransferase [Chloroflexi bacterium]|nr:GCN5-related N-acetyltransferase [Chloroflexota bacterium]
MAGRLNCAPTPPWGTQRAMMSGARPAFKTIQEGQRHMADLTDQGTSPPIINIVGRRVALGPMSHDLLPVYHRWANDFDVELMGGEIVRPATMESVAADLEHYTRSRNRVHFTIFETAALQPIGWVNLRDIDYEHRTATMGISINEKSQWGRGYGTEATMLIIDYGFRILGLHNIMLDTFSGNLRAINTYLRVGFREIGRRREAHRIGSRVYDIVFMECLASEFTSPLPPVVEVP